MTERGEDGNAYYPQCFKEPCEGMGCKIEQCKFSEAACDRLAAYEDSGLSPEDAANLNAILRLGDGMTLMRLRELAVADQEGRVIVLPCKVGDRVYIPDIESKTVANVRVQGISITPKSRVALHFGGYPVESAWGDRCGIDWFITIEEAEKALAEMEGKKDD